MAFLQPGYIMNDGGCSGFDAAVIAIDPGDIIISSKMTTARIPEAALSTGTISASKISASGSGRRRSRGAFFCDGSLESCSIR